MGPLTRTLGEKEVIAAGSGVCSQSEHGQLHQSSACGPVAAGQSCPALGALGHLDLQVLILIQVAGSVSSLLGAKASTADLPKEGDILLLPAEPVGAMTGGQSGSLLSWC